MQGMGSTKKGSMICGREKVQMDLWVWILTILLNTGKKIEEEVKQNNVPSSRGSSERTDNKPLYENDLVLSKRVKQFGQKRDMICFKDVSI